MSSTIELLTHRSRKAFCAVLIILFVYILADRDMYIVPDTIAYVDTYETVQADTHTFFQDWNAVGIRFEPGYMFLNVLAKKIGLDVKTFLGMLALLPCMVYMYAVSADRTHDKTGRLRGNLVCVDFSLWVFFWGFIYSGITVRVGLAIQFAFLAHIFLREKKFLKAAVSFYAAYTFHYSILAYPLFLYASTLIKMKHKDYYIYGALVFVLWIMNLNNTAVLSLHLVTAALLSFMTSNVSALSRYSGYTDNLYNSFTSRKNFLFLVLLFVFIKARPKNDQNYDHWLKFFALNMALTFPLSTFITGYRVSDICLVSALPLLSHCAVWPKFSVGLRITICLTFMISMLIFALRMTGVY